MAARLIHLLDAVTPETGETFEALLDLRGVRIERIASSATPDDTLYDQPQDEWVVLLQGEAGLWIDDVALRLRAGDAVFIPAHTPHRVTDTASEPPCIWLAVHIDPAPAGATTAPPSAAG